MEVQQFSPNLRDEINDLIHYYFDDSTPLLKHQKELYERIIEADKLLNDTTIKSDRERAERLAKRFNVSLATARQDIIKSMEFFTKVQVIDIATSFRLLLAKVKKYETLCEETKTLKELPKLLEIEYKILDKLANESKNQTPTVTEKPIIICLSGDIAKQNMQLPKYDHKEVVKFIDEQNIPDEEKQRLRSELGEE